MMSDKKTIKTIKFEDGSRYEGEVNESGQPHGKGHLVSNSPTGCGRKDHYQGEFKNGKKDGYGHMKYELNGYIAEYKGEWHDDMRCGKGKYSRMSMGGGARHCYEYDGEWLDDKEHGQGVSINSDEKGIHLSTIMEKYTGGFANGQRHGHGKIERDGYDGNFSDGKEYFEGEFVEGKLSGHCVHTMVNGDICEFQDGYCNGIGTYTFKNGVRFTALWQNGKLDFDTVEMEGDKSALLLWVSESHHGFGCSESLSCVMVAKKGMQRYNEAMIVINWDYHINSKDACLEITKVTDDSVTYVVKPYFLEGNDSITDTIKRGERKDYKNEIEHTGRMYDEEFEYTSGSELLIICR